MTTIGDENLVATKENSGWRSLLPGGAFYPFSLAFVAFALFDVVAPWALFVKNGRRASVYVHEMHFSDGLSAEFWIADPSRWQRGLFVATVFSLMAQRAVFAIWIAFGRGRWPTRLGIVLVAATCLRGIVQAQLTAPHESWRDVFAPFAALPLNILSYSTPFVIAAMLTGWRLQRKDLSMQGESSRRRFSIADLLLITAVVAVSLALWKYRFYGQDANGMAESMLSRAMAMIYSTIYVLPILWTTLAVRRHRFALLLTALVVAMFLAALLFSTSDGVWEFVDSTQIGMVCGTLLTAPAALLLWRLCGYRLTRTRYNAAGESACGNA